MIENYDIKEMSKILKYAERVLSYDLEHNYINKAEHRIAMDALLSLEFEALEYWEEQFKNKIFADMSLKRIKNSEEC